MEYISKLLGYPINVSKNPLIVLRNKLMYRWLFRLCAFVSTEFQQCADVLSHDLGVKIGCVPNQFNPNEIRTYRPFSERSNMILYVGRIERAKGSHTLLEAFSYISSKISDWTLKLTGSVKDKDITDKFAYSHPELKDRVIFTGQITDREEMTELYQKTARKPLALAMGMNGSKLIY